MALDGFEVITFGNAGAFVSITRNGITFSKAALEKVNSAGHVTLLVNRETKQFAIKPCSPSEANAMPFYRSETNCP